MLPDPSLLQDLQMTTSSIGAEATDGAPSNADHAISEMAHDDGEINGAGVYTFRLNLGRKCGLKMMNEADHGDRSPATENG